MDILNNGWEIQWGNKVYNSNSQKRNRDPLHEKGFNLIQPAVTHRPIRWRSMWKWSVPSVPCVACSPHNKIRSNTILPVSTYSQLHIEIHESHPLSLPLCTVQVDQHITQHIWPAFDHSVWIWVCSWFYSKITSDCAESQCLVISRKHCWKVIVLLYYSTAPWKVYNLSITTIIHKKCNGFLSRRQKFNSVVIFWPWLSSMCFLQWR